MFISPAARLTAVRRTAVTFIQMHGKGGFVTPQRGNVT